MNLTEKENVLAQDLEISKTFNNYFNNVVQTLCNQVEKTSTKSDQEYLREYFSNILDVSHQDVSHPISLFSRSIFKSNK